MKADSAFKQSVLDTIHDQTPSSVTTSIPTIGKLSTLAPQADEPTPITIISNCRLLRDGLTTLLQPLMPLLLVNSYSATCPTPSYVPDLVGHVALVDANMGLDPCLVWIRYWRTQSVHAIVIELQPELDFILTCIETGAGGYTLQDASAAEIVETIKEVRRGNAHCSPQVAGQLFARLARRGTSNGAVSVSASKMLLTARELEVLKYVAKGYSNQAIADALVIEVRTVKHHVHNILEKLDLSRRWDAARFADEQGWL